MRNRSTVPGLLLALSAVFVLAGCGTQNKEQTSEQDKTQSEQQAPQEATTNSNVQASTPEPAPAPETVSTPEPQAQSQPTCLNCGTVIAIEAHDTVRSNTSAEAITGAVVGAVAGVMLGSSQFSGDEETVAEIAGGIAGAVAGHQIGKRAATDSYFVVTIDMKHDGTKQIRVDQTGTLSVGQKVRVVDHTIRPR